MSTTFRRLSLGSIRLLLSLLTLLLFPAATRAANTGPQLTAFSSNGVLYASVTWRDADSNLLTRAEVTIDFKAWYSDDETIPLVKKERDADLNRWIYQVSSDFFPDSPKFVRLTTSRPRPTATAGPVVALEDQSTVIDLPGNGANGLPGSSLVRVITSLPLHGKLYDGATQAKEITLPGITVTDPQARVSYVPNPDYFGPDFISYKVKEGWVESSSRLVPITVRNIEDPPVATGPLVTTDEDTPVIFALDGFDVDGDPLQSTIRLVTGHGTLYQVEADGVTRGPAITSSPAIITNPGKLVCFVPEQDFSGFDTLRYDVFDGITFSDRLTITITVREINDPPVARPATHLGDNSIPVVAVLLDWYDVDTPMHGRITQFPAKGQLYRKTVAPENLLTPENNEISDLDLQYVHAEPLGGPAAQYTFTYVVDDLDYVSPPITDTIIIQSSTKREPLPTGTPANVFFHPAAPVDFALNGVDPDGDSSALIFRILTLPQHGTLSSFDLNDNPVPITSVPFTMPSSDPTVGWRLRYTPSNGADDSFTFSLQDQDGLFYSAPDHSIQEVVVTLSNSSPVAHADPVLLDEDTEATFALSGTDPQGLPLTSTVRLLPANGKLYQMEADGVTIGSEITSVDTIVTNPDGLVHYIPAPNYNALPTADTVRYDLFNGTDYSFRITVNIGISPVNDPPFARAAVHTGDRLSPIPVILDAGDVDSAFTGRITQFPAKGRLYRKSVSAENEITPASPDFTDIDLWYVPNEPVNGSPVDYTFSYFLHDEAATTPTVTDTIQVTFLNQMPLPTGSPTNVVISQLNVPVNITLHGVDPDGDSDALLFTIVDPPRNGYLSAKGIGTYVRITSYPFTLPASTPAEGWQIQYTSTEGALDAFTFTLRDEDGLYYTDPSGEIRVIVYITPDS